MEDQLISFETAVLAKEKGFIFPKHADMYVVTKVGNRLSTDGPEWKEQYPTQTSLQTWLRDKYNIHVIVEPKNAWEYKTLIKYYINNQVNVAGFPDTTIFNSYEEALEKGLFQALKLISYNLKK